MNIKIFSSFALLFLLPGLSVSAETFNSSGTWTAPADAKTVLIETWGGGGSGGTGYKTKNHNVSGFGGGAGGYASKTMAVTPGDIFTVTVGSAGTYGGGSNSEVSKGGTAVVGAGGGGAGMNGVGNYSGSGTSGGNGIGPGAGAGGTNNTYIQKGNLLNKYDDDFYTGKDGYKVKASIQKDNFFSFIKNILSITKVFAQDVPPPIPTFDVFYTGVAGQGGQGYIGDVLLIGLSGGGYSKVGDNPYASNGGSSPQGGTGGMRGRLGRDGGGSGNSGDTWALDGGVVSQGAPSNGPGAGGGGSDTGSGGWGGAGRVIITVTETQQPPVVRPIDLCPNNECVVPVTVIDNPPVAERFNPKGWLENASCTALSGWAYDGDVPNQSINVHLYDGPASYGKIITSVSTSQYRGDVNTSESIITGNHGFSYATPASLKNGADHLIYAYGINNTSTAPNAQLLGSPIILNCPQTLPPPVIVPAVTVSANPTALTAPGTVQISWVSANINSATNKCVVLSSGWSSGEKSNRGTETSPVISNTTTFTVACTSTSGGIGFDSVTIPVTTVIPPVTPITPVLDSNAISYNSIPASVTVGQSFNVLVTNSGTRTWGSAHQLGILPVGGNSVFFASLGTTVGLGQKIVTMTAPNTPGSYVIRAVQQGDGWFGETRALNVVAIVITPPDLCPNIPGNQASVPTGMVVVAGNCVVNNPVVGNGISYASIPPTVQVGQSFNVSVVNTGSKTWGGSHQLAIKPWPSGNAIQLVSLGDTAPGSSKIVTMTAPGTSNTYSLEAVEQGVEWFGGPQALNVVTTVVPPVVVVPPAIITTVTGNPGGNGGGTVWTCTPQVPVSITTPPLPPICVLTCNDPWVKNSNGSACMCNPSTVEVNNSCVIPNFTLIATPATVKLKSVSGYSGAIEQPIVISVSPVYGFNGDVTITPDASLNDYGVEYSINSNTSYSSSFTPRVIRLNGPVNLTIRMRFKKLPPRDQEIILTFQGTGYDSRIQPRQDLVNSVQVKLDSQPLYPGYNEM